MEEEKTALELFNEAFTRTGRVPEPAQEAYAKSLMRLTLLKQSEKVDLQALLLKKILESDLLLWFEIEMHKSPQAAADFFREVSQGQMEAATFLATLQHYKHDEQVRHWFVKLALVYHQR